MGYTFTHKPKGESYADFFRREVFGDGWEIVESATISRVFYAAARELSSGHVKGVVIETTTDRHPICNFGYKATTEDLGPAHYMAPARVLDALTPLTEIYDEDERDSDCFKWAEAWRTRCRAIADKPKVKKGDLVRFKENLTFTDGTIAREFIYSGRGGIFSIPGRETRLRLGNWRVLSYEVVKEET